MNREQYLATQIKITQIGAQLQQLNLYGFIEMASRAEAAAPMIDPTLYRRGADRLDALKKFAAALVPAQERFIELVQITVQGLAQDAEQGFTAPVFP